MNQPLFPPHVKGLPSHNTRSPSRDASHPQPPSNNKGKPHTAASRDAGTVSPLSNPNVACPDDALAKPRWVSHSRGTQPCTGARSPSCSTPRSIAASRAEFSGLGKVVDSPRSRTPTKTVRRFNIVNNLTKVADLAADPKVFNAPPSSSRSTPRVQTHADGTSGPVPHVRSVLIPDRAREVSDRAFFGGSKRRMPSPAAGASGNSPRADPSYIMVAINDRRGVAYVSPTTSSRPSRHPQQQQPQDTCGKPAEVIDNSPKVSEANVRSVRQLLRGDGKLHAEKANNPIASRSAKSQRLLSLLHNGPAGANTALSQTDYEGVTPAGVATTIVAPCPSKPCRRMSKRHSFQNSGSLSIKHDSATDSSGSVERSLCGTNDPTPSSVPPACVREEHLLKHVLKSATTTTAVCKSHPVGETSPPVMMRAGESRPTPRGIHVKSPIHPSTGELGVGALAQGHVASTRGRTQSTGRRHPAPSPGDQSPRSVRSVSGSSMQTKSLDGTSLRPTLRTVSPAFKLSYPYATIDSSCGSTRDVHRKLVHGS